MATEVRSFSTLQPTIIQVQPYHKIPSRVPPTSTISSLQAETVSPTKEGSVIPLDPLSLSTTAELADLLRTESKESPLFSSLKQLALETAGSFHQKSLSLQAYELAELGKSQDPDIIHCVLLQLTQALQASTLTDVNLFKALAKTIELADGEHLKIDDLFQILSFLNDKISSLSQEQEASLLTQLEALSSLLEALSLINIKGLSEDETCRSLLSFLEKMKSHTNQTIAFHASYSLQALLHLKNDENKLCTYMRKALHLAEGTSLLMAAWGQKSLTTIFDAFVQFKKALKLEHTKKTWYQTIQLARLLLKQGLTLEAENLLRNEAKTLPFPSSFVLESISHTSQPKARSDLLEITKTSLAWRLVELRLKRSASKEEESLYISGQASYTPHYGERFDLANKVKEVFSQENKKVLLIQGASGAGKSLFLQILEKELWTQFNLKAPIPLYIRLAGIDPNTTTLLEDALQAHGFDEAQVQALKASRKFILLLDGYDEIKERTSVNLFQRNHLTHWNAQLIITCRSQRLTGDSYYKSLFAPYVGDHPDFGQLSELYIMPFSQDQITAYFAQFVEKTKASWPVSRYLQEVSSFRGLQSLIETPFLLRIVADVLPLLVSERTTAQDIELTRRALYNKFVTQWGERQEQKLIDAGISYPDNIQSLYKEFCENLALKMVEEGLVEVVYEKIEALFETDETSPWDIFFGEDPDLSLIRQGCPLTQTSHGYAFIHKSLLEHFASSATTQQLERLRSVRQKKMAKQEAFIEEIELNFKPSFSFKNTKDLVYILTSSQQAIEQHLASRFAWEIIQIFRKKSLPSPEEINELSSLSSISDKEMIHTILEAFARRIDQEFLTNLSLFQGLAKALTLAPPDCISPEDLPVILDVSRKKIAALPKTGSEETLYCELSALNHLLDALVDDNNLKIDHQSIDILYDELSALKTDNLQLQAVIEYSKQAVLRLPSNENKLATLLKKGTLVMRGISSLTEAAGTYSPLKLVEGFCLFKEAFKTKSSQKTWYERLRTAQILLKQGAIQEASSLINEKPAHPSFTTLMILSIDREICSSSNDDRRLQLLELLLHFEEGTVIISTLVANYQTFDHPDLRAIVSKISDKCHDSFDTFLYQDPPIFLNASPLFAEVKATISGLLFNLYNIAVHDPLLKNEEALHIPLQGALSFADKNHFPLKEKVEEFLEGEKKLLLLLGSSGSGKSLFTKLLVSQKWQEGKTTAIVPFFISLTGISTSSTTIIEEALYNTGFTHSQVQFLKQNQRFILVLDGYDEMQGEIGVNLYESNSLKDWQGKVIITCRSQSIEHLNSYQKLFFPIKEGKIDYLDAEEIVTAPFSDSQINTYLEKYIAHTKSPWILSLYRNYIDTLPGLREMIENPFVLRILTEVLPDIIEKHKSLSTLERLRLTRVDIYEAFVQKWHARQIDKLVRSGKLSQTKNIEKQLYSFAVRLASEMHARKLTEISYEPPSRFKTTPYEWEVLLGNKRPEIVRARAAAPLIVSRNGAKVCYRFLHKSLLEFLASRDTFGSVDLNIDESLFLAPTQDPSLESASSDLAEIIAYSPLNKRLFVQENGTLKFWVDDVHQKEGFKETLIKIVELSKKDHSIETAAANSLTILVMADVSFSGQDLSGIRVPGAILDGANFYGTCLNNAHLKGCSMQGVEMRNALLKNANLEDVSFGEGLSFSGDAMAYSPSGKYLALSSRNNINIWDPTSGKCLTTLKEALGSTITSLAYSPSETHLAAVSEIRYYRIRDELLRRKDQFAIHIWEVFSGRCLHIFEVYHGRSSWQPSPLISYAPSGNELASSTPKGIKIWSTSSGECLHTIEGALRQRCLTYSPSGDHLAFEGDNCIRIWNIASAQYVHKLSEHTDVNGLAYAPSGKHLASASGDRYNTSKKNGAVRIWDLSSGECIRILKKHTGTVLSVTYSPSGEYLASGGADQIVRIWDAFSGKCLSTFEGHRGNVNHLTYAASGELLASHGGDIRIWETSAKVSLQNEERAKHSDAVCGLAYSPSGEHLASGSPDKTIRIWASFSGQCLNVFLGDEEIAGALAYSPSGERLASVSRWDEKELCFWDAASGLKLGKLPGNPTGTCFTYAPSGNFLAWGSKDKTIRVWDTESGKCVQILKSHKKGITSITYDLSGEFLASGSDDGTIRIWNASSGKCLHILKNDERRTLYVSSINSMVYSPSRKHLAAGNLNNFIQIWDTNSGKCLHTLQGHEEDVNSLAYNPSGKHLVSGSRDANIRVWDIFSGNCLKIIKGHKESVNTVVYSPSGEFLASGSDDGTIRIWKIWKEESDLQVTLIRRQDKKFSCQGLNMENVKTNDQTLAVLRQRGAEENKNVSSQEEHTNHGNEVTKIIYEHSGMFFASASYDKTVRVWDAFSGKCLQILKHSERVWGLAYAPSGNVLASGDDRGTLSIWNPSSGECLSTLKGHKKVIYSIAYSPQGDILASASRDKTIRLWNASLTKCLKVLRGHSREVRGLSYNPAGDRLASVSADATVRIWNPASGKCVRTLRGHKLTAYAVVYSPSGEQLASSGLDIHIWDPISGKILQILKKESHQIAYSPSGEKLASANHDYTISIWEVSSGICLHVLRGANYERPSGIGYSPSGESLATGWSSGIIRIGETASGKWLNNLTEQTIRGEEQYSDEKKSCVIS